MAGKLAAGILFSICVVIVFPLYDIIRLQR